MSIELDIRPMLFSDIEAVYKWRTNPSISKYMLSEEPQSFGSHLEWFKRTSLDENKALLIADYHGRQVGFAQFDNVKAKKDSNWGFYKDPSLPKGMGRKICTAALDYGFTILGLDLIFGQVLHHNLASIKLHLGLGFRENNDGIQLNAGEKLRHFEMRSSDWLKHSGN